MAIGAAIAICLLISLCMSVTVYYARQYYGNCNYNEDVVQVEI